MQKQTIDHPTDKSTSADGYRRTILRKRDVRTLRRVNHGLYN